MKYIKTLIDFIAAAFFVLSAYSVYSTGLTFISMNPPSMGVGASIAIDLILAYFIFRIGYNSIFKKEKIKIQ